jgi:hypothetical protein
MCGHSTYALCMDFFLNPIRSGLYIAAQKTADVFAPSSQSIETPAKRTLRRVASLPASKSTEHSSYRSKSDPTYVVMLTPEQKAHMEHQETVRRNVSRAVNEEIKLANNRAEYLLERALSMPSSQPQRPLTLEQEAKRYNLTLQEAARLPGVRQRMEDEAKWMATRVRNSSGHWVSPEEAEKERKDIETEIRRQTRQRERAQKAAEAAAVAAKAQKMRPAIMSIAARTRRRDQGYANFIAHRAAEQMRTNSQRSQPVQSHASTLKKR